MTDYSDADAGFAKIVGVTMVGLTASIIAFSAGYNSGEWPAEGCAIGCGERGMELYEENRDDSGGGKAVCQCRP